MGSISRVCTVLHILNAWILGYNPTEGTNICPCFLWSYVILCTGLAMCQFARPRSPTKYLYYRFALIRQALILNWNEIDSLIHKEHEIAKTYVNPVVMV